MEDMVFGRRYRVTEKLGAGGMAEVYKAVDEVLGRTVAVKVLHPRYAGEENFVARFRQEAQAAANLSHPNIVNIYDWGREDETYYIVMEYVRGTDLKSLVEERGPQDPSKVAEWATQVCSALAVAHGYDVIHRDIKPHNIVLTPDGTVKVMDFGIARAGNTTMTQTGSVLGTAHYVSPEQAQGRALGPASDLYSLGVVLYELTTGRVPFEADTPVAVALKQVNEEPIPPRRIRPDLPMAMEAVILRAMEKDPRDRYVSAEEMRNDLRRVVSGQTVSTPAADQTTVMPMVPAGAAPAPGESSQVRAVPRRRPVWPWLLALFVALLLVGFGTAWALGLFERGVQVPRVIGMSEEEAVSTIENAGLLVGEVETRFSEDATPGVVIDQSPVPGTSLTPQSEVDLVVSKGREQAEVPDVTDLTESEAEAQLQEMGFRVNTQREFSADVEPEHVIRTVPEPGAEVDRGETVTLIVSKGVETVRVPDVTGQSRSEAEQALREAGFGVKVNDAFSDSVDEGDVISQSPSGGSILDAGSTVTITVSKGERRISVPDVRGLTESEARRTLREAELQANVNYQPHDQDDVVLTQDPAAGTEVRPGATVTIWVGRTPGDGGDEGEDGT